VVEKTSLGHPGAGHNIVDRDCIDRPLGQQFKACFEQGRPRSGGTRIERERSKTGHARLLPYLTDWSIRHT